VVAGTVREYDGTLRTLCLTLLGVSPPNRRNIRPEYSRGRSVPVGVLDIPRGVLVLGVVSTDADNICESVVGPEDLNLRVMANASRTSFESGTVSPSTKIQSGRADFPRPNARPFGRLNLG
jgi:hypothetical protein